MKDRRETSAENNWINIGYIFPDLILKNHIYKQLSDFKQDKSVNLRNKNKNRHIPIKLLKPQNLRNKIVK